jgi:zinc finger protein DZIP1
VDSNFIKLFRLAQLTIEYLLHSQQYLSDQRTQCEQHIQQLQKELEVCRSEASAKVEEVKTVKRENRKRRKIIEAYQDMLSQGATGLHPCPVCSKEFVSKQYLDSHVQRRHPNHLQNMTATADDKQALSQEEIERRLMEQMNEKFQITEQLLRQELARKEGESLQSQAREFEQWKQMQQEKRKVEMEEVQAPLREKLRALEQEKEQLHRELQEKQAEVVAMKRHSHTQESDCAGEVKGHEMVDSSTATGMKHLETKV